MKYSASLLVAASLAAAQSSTVVDVLLLAFDSQTIDASVVAVAPTATTYALNCHAATDVDCGLPDDPKIQIVYGPSTLAYSFSIGPVSDKAVCIATITSDGETSATRSTETDTLTKLAESMMQITVTAGLDKLAAEPTGTLTSSSQTGGMPPQITQNAVLVGAAALVGGAMML
ncbi:hypothetical protein C7999DRAFT_13909 [Corynascus novoguineensis]|uniref:Uncharacterized protein n=1 Tax=Corynascus novoguineensis TaxID=1126955 RepID=A0AAN7CTQ1_9PEZI|nr:hypothetical protein C7999DRAFT_13909 [Corynascus novoguineensis]